MLNVAGFRTSNKTASANTWEQQIKGYRLPMKSQAGLSLKRMQHRVAGYTKQFLESMNPKHDIRDRGRRKEPTRGAKRDDFNRIQKRGKQNLRLRNQLWERDRPNERRKPGPMEVGEDPKAVQTCH